MILTVIASLSLAIWLYIIFGRGGFWRISEKVMAPIFPPRPGMRVIAIVPARNEAEVIRASVSSLLNQDYRPALEVIVVDDLSDDGTSSLAHAEARNVNQSNRLTVISGEPLPLGWTGKLWALAQGVELALRRNPDYLLFTDADIIHARNNLSELVATAGAKNCDLASLMVRLACVSFAEKALIPAFVFFFLQLYPPRWTASSRAKTAGAAGGCILIRPQALARAGGMQAIASEVIDDCALAEAVKRTGGTIWMGLASSTRSVRSYSSFAQIREMVARTAFSQLNHSTLLLGAAVAGLFITYIIPVIAMGSGNALPAFLGLLTWLLMSGCYLPIVRFYRRSPLWCLTLPVIAAFYLAATINSAVRYWRGGGGMWKGRIQDART